MKSYKKIWKESNCTIKILKSNSLCLSSRQASLSPRSLGWVPGSLGLIPMSLGLDTPLDKPTRFTEAYLDKLQEPDFKKEKFEIISCAT